MKFNAALTIGATGMLKGALDFTLANAVTTHIVSRHAERDFADQGLPHSLDYADNSNFVNTLQARIPLPSIDLCLLWMHDSGNTAAMALLEALSNQDILIVHIAGSAAGDPTRQLENVGRRISFGPACTYCPVILGNMPDGDTSRWLTHKEISKGAMDAITTGHPQMVGNPLS